MALTKSQLKHFKHWMEDGNVIKNNDGTYSTQDAQFSNRLKDLNELKKYFKREFAVDEYADGGGVGEIEYKIGDIFEGNPKATYEENWQLFKPLKSYVIDNKTNKIVSIHKTPYEAIEKRNSLDKNFKLHYEVKPKEFYNKMKTGGGVGGKLKKSKANVTNDMRGEDSDDYGTFEIYKNGGNIEVKVVNSDKQYNEKQYDWILGDKDKDSVANADDVKPLDKNIKERIDEPTITTGIKNLISLKKSLDSTMYSFIEDLKNVAPNNSKIYARTKTPYSVLDKLIKKRLSTITDLIGTTIVTNDKKELDAVKNYVESGKIGKVVEMEDMYEKPKQGYRAYHFLIERNGMTIELQVKTKRQKALNELSHEPYKLGKLNSAVNLKMTELANRADEGDKNAIKEYNHFMNQPNVEKLFYADGGNKMADGGGIKKQVYTYTDKNLEGRYATRFIRSAGENGLSKYVERLSNTKVKITVPSDKKESEELLEIVEFSIGRNNLVPFHSYGGSIEDENREMVLNENNQIIHHTKELPTAIKGKRVPAWVVTKVHESASDLSDATHYMDGQKMAKGGNVKYVDTKFSQNNSGIPYFLEFKDAVGSFAWKYGKYNEGILYNLSDFDKDYYSHLPLKMGEKLFRYSTDRMIDDSKYLIKINLDKGLIYFMSEENDRNDDKNISFETKGIKSEYITLDKDKFSNGGKMSNGGSMVGTKVKVSFRKEIGVVKDYDNDWATVYYPDLGFSEKVNLKSENVTIVGEMEKGGAVSEDNKFNYMMLGRLQADCEYYLGNGNRSERVLWAGNVDDHIEEMKKIWNNLPKDGKPEWLSMGDIKNYENKMKNNKMEKDNNKFYALTSDGMKNKRKQIIKSVSFWKERVSKHTPTLENIKDFLEQVPFDEIIAIYSYDDSSFYGELHSAYTPLYTNGAKSVYAIIDSDNKIVWNKYEGSKYVLNVSDYKMENGGMMAKGGGLGDTIADRYARLTKTEGKRLDELSKKVRINEQTEAEDVEWDKLVHKYRGWDYANKMVKGGVIYSGTMRTNDGNIVGKVQYNDHYKTYQVVIDGVTYEEFKTEKEAIENLKNAGFGKAETKYKKGDSVMMFEDEPALIITEVYEWSDKGNTYDLASEDGKIKRGNISYTKLSPYKMAKGGGLGDLKVGSKLGLLNPRNGRYKYSTIEKIEGEDVFLVEKHPTRSQWDNHWKTTKSQIARFLNENNADFKSKKSYVLKMEDGGSMDSQQGIDLFEDYENIPANVQSVLDNHEDAFMDGDYKELQKALTQLKKIGYTFEFDLDGQAYDLRPIGTKGKSEMEEYEEGTEAFKQGGNVESSVTKLNKLGIRTSNEFGDEFRDFLDRLEENNDGEYIGYRLDLPNNELTLIQEKATKTVSILDYSQFPKNGSWRIEKHSIIHYKEGGSMTNKNQTTMTQEHIDKFVRGANSTDATAREISTRKLKEAGLDKNGKPLESKKAMTKSKSEPTPKYKVGDILNHKDNGENYKVKIEAVTGWTGDEHRYDVEFLDENLKPLNKFAKSYDDKLSKPKTEKKEKATNTSKAPMTDSKETEDEYCKRIIAEARARKLKAKKIAKKSANKPAVTKATERVERTHESIEKQIETGKLKKEQIEKIIAETEDLLRMLKKALKSL